MRVPDYVVPWIRSATVGSACYSSVSGLDFGEQAFVYTLGAVSEWGMDGSCSLLLDGCLAPLLVLRMMGYALRRIMTNVVPMALRFEVLCGLCCPITWEAKTSSRLPVLAVSGAGDV